MSSASDLEKIMADWFQQNHPKAIIFDERNDPDFGDVRAFCSIYLEMYGALRLIGYMNREGVHLRDKRPIIHYTSYNPCYPEFFNKIEEHLKILNKEEFWYETIMAHSPQED